MSRARFAAAALAALTTGAAAIVMTLAPASASAPPAEGAPGASGPAANAQGAAAAAAAPTAVSTTQGTRTLIVDPASDLPEDNATIRVQGKGFSTKKGLYIAVCADGSGAPTDLSKCVGGAIPEGNSTTGWAHITTDGTGTGGVKAAWGADGSFAVTLALPSVTSGAVNCVTAKCSLYTTSDDGAVRSEDNAVALTFAAPPPPSSSSSSSAPPTAPGTAIPQVISPPTGAPGATQLVVFSGFRAGEQVNLTLFSDPITLSPVTADATGVARVQFVVPADLVAGTHRLEAIGQQSGTVGVAVFQVTAPPPVSSPTPTPSSSPSSSSASPTPSSSSAVSSSSVVSSSAPVSRTAVSSSAAGGTTDDGGDSLWWLWLILGVVVLAGIITGVVVYRRNQQAQREQDEQEIADAAAREQQATPDGGSADDAPTVFLPPVEPGGPPPGADPYGLLSGHDHPDNPTLYSGRDAGPTEVIGEPDYQGPGPYGQPLGYGGAAQGYPPAPEAGAPGVPPAPDATGGPPTEALPPTGGASADPTGSGADGSGTQAWTPDFDDTEHGAGDDGPDDDGPDGPDASGDRRR